MMSKTSNVQLGATNTKQARTFKYMTHTGSMLLIIKGMSSASTLTHYRPKLIHTLLYYKLTIVDEKFLHYS